MRQISDGVAPPFDFWSYFDQIPPADFEGYDCSDGRVCYVYRHPNEVLEHVLVNSSDRNVFMVLVLDRSRNLVVGHHLLNLRTLYGLAGELSN